MTVLGAHMTAANREHLSRVRALWEGGKPLEAGQILFDALEPDVRPKWASNVLRFILRKSGISTELFEQVLFTAETKRMWANGHRVFSTLRASVLELDALASSQRLTSRQSLLRDVLCLAE